MYAVSTPDLELNEAWVDSDERKRVHVTFPISALTGAQASAVVYFKVQPGETLATHTDSAEEILYIVAGEGEAIVGDERGRIRAGDLALIPELVPHGLVNDGDEPLEVVGFFAAAEVESNFFEPLQPMGQPLVSIGVA